MRGCQSTHTLYQLVPSQFVPKSTASLSQLKYSETAVPTGNLFKSNNHNTETLTLTLSNAESLDMGTSWLDTLCGAFSIFRFMKQAISHEG